MDQICKAHQAGTPLSPCFEVHKVPKHLIKSSISLILALQVIYHSWAAKIQRALWIIWAIMWAIFMELKFNMQFSLSTLYTGWYRISGTFVDNVLICVVQECYIFSKTNCCTDLVFWKCGAKLLNKNITYKRFRNLVYRPVFIDTRDFCSFYALHPNDMTAMEILQWNQWKYGQNKMSITQQTSTISKKFLQMSV